MMPARQMLDYPFRWLQDPRGLGHFARCNRSLVAGDRPMLFNSLHFILLFFPVAVTGYYLLPHQLRWFWLLVLSAYFYMAFVPYYIAILAVTILVDYVAGI